MAHAEEESKEGRKEGRMHDSRAVFQKEKKKTLLCTFACFVLIHS
jgi:hypothetical protein